ncbi:glycoside hydrolase [Metabacillus elymi]|uniref:RICIN domain-containing protein n=1 Tax=Metabacillus elymi TaxID=2745198 RepID=A0ABX6S3Q9_9BACI|nr:glycoside hydrolase [Metabacillus sp. KUDC1714]QNF28725.1 RICIN domain-containing protein [Metabacillus sp. KUDC1714]
MLQEMFIKRLLIKCLILVVVVGSILPALPTMTNAEEGENELISDSEQIKLDPSYQHEPFDGWGTALVWFANVTGGWPDELRNELADDLFGKDGLNFNIARYNIGGGDSPETEPYMRKGGAVPGYWNRPAEYSPPEGNTDEWTEQENWWNPENPEHWNLEADANQRWWVSAAKARGADTFEAFSNSPPYFMTQSGYVSGNWNSWDDNIKPDQFENFASYLTTVVEHLQKDMDVEFQTLSPVNEPNTGYWRAKGRQEGSNWSPASQAKIINEVKKQLDEKGLSTVVSGMDETNPQKFRQNWEQYDSTTRNNIEQLNVHTYGPTQQIGARDIAKSAGKKLWMSEVDLSSGAQNHEDIIPGLALSQRITTDIQKLESEAWVLWQSIEDEVNMSPEHENGNWGLIQVDFDPADFENVKIYKNKKYYAMGNYSKFIRPGYQVINSNSSDTLAAINKDDNSVVVVYTNSTTEEKAINFDLSGFDTVEANAKATPYVTSTTENLAQKSDVMISGNELSAVVQPQSITTFVVSGVSGVNEDNSFLNNNETYKFINKNSGKVLDIGQDGKSIVQKTNIRDEEKQNFSIQKITDGNSTKEIYKIANSDSGSVLSDENGSITLQANENKSNQKWMLSTYGNGEYTFINVQSGNLIEVGGESKEEGAKVGLWKPTTGNHQIWRLVKAGIAKVEPVDVVVTKKKTAPELPDEVTTIYGDGEEVQKKVVWDTINPDLYAKENIFKVEGTVEGTTIKAVATITVSKIESIQPIKIKTTPGKAPILPNKVTAKLKSGTFGKVPVEWNEIDQNEYADFGKFSVKGSISKSPVKAIANIQVTQPALENLAVKPSSSENEYPKVSASFTGQWDSTSNVNDGIISSARWTNWDPNSWREEDWVAIEFDKAETVSQVKFHFYDDNGGTRPADSLRLEYLDGTEWKEIEGTQTDVQDKELTIDFTQIETKHIRAVMKAKEGACIAISEMEVLGIGENQIPGQGSDATLETILINGKQVKEFDKNTYNYQVKIKKNQQEIPTIEAVTNDLFATYQIETPSSLEGEAVITVKSEDGKNHAKYTVEFSEKN